MILYVEPLRTDTHEDGRANYREEAVGVVNL